MGAAVKTDRLTTSTPHPSVFLLLNLPFGLSTGYIIIILPLRLTASGVSVAATASVVAFAISPKVWKFLSAPLVDLTLTLKRWYVLGAITAGTMVIVSGLVPVSPNLLWPVALCAFLAEVGSGFVTTALGGLMAESMPDEQKGRAAGWYQLGAKLARGLVGGAGVWLLARERTELAPALLMGTMCFLPIGALLLVPQPQTKAAGSMMDRLIAFGRDFSGLFNNRRSRFVMILLLTPIGIIGVSNFWSGVAAEWKASANLIALMTGPMEAVAAGAGCLLAGWLADQFDRRIVYLGCGTLLSFVALGLSRAPSMPVSFVVGSFSVSLLLGMGDAAFSALILSVIGVRNAATKYAMLSSLGNIPDIYMTSVSGFTHDAWGTARMLQLEAGIELLCIALATAWILIFQRNFVESPGPAGESV